MRGGGGATRSAPRLPSQQHRNAATHRKTNALADETSIQNTNSSRGPAPSCREKKRVAGPAPQVRDNTSKSNRRKRSASAGASMRMGPIHAQARHTSRQNRKCSRRATARMRHCVDMHQGGTRKVTVQKKKRWRERGREGGCSAKQTNNNNNKNSECEEFGTGTRAERTKRGDAGT